MNDSINRFTITTTALIDADPFDLELVRMAYPHFADKECFYLTVMYSLVCAAIESVEGFRNCNEYYEYFFFDEVTPRARLHTPLLHEPGEEAELQGEWEVATNDSEIIRRLETLNTVLHNLAEHEFAYSSGTNCSTAELCFQCYDEATFFEYFEVTPGQFGFSFELFRIGSVAVATRHRLTKMACGHQSHESLPLTRRVLPPDPSTMNTDERVRRCDLALIRGRVDDLQLLLNADPDLIANFENNHGPPVFMAAGANQPQIIELLVEFGATVNPEYRGDSAMCEAVFAGAGGAIAALATLGVDVNDNIEENTKALHVAANGHMLQAIQALLEAGADVNAIGDDGTPLDCAILREDRVDESERDQAVYILRQYGGRRSDELPC